MKQWGEIVRLLEMHISGVAAKLPPIGAKPTGVEMKAFEDALDAVVCAWVAICALRGCAKPYGDAASAIWIPCERR